MVSETLRNIFWYNEIWSKTKKKIIQENALEHVVCKMATILSQPECVNSLGPSDTIWRERSGSPLAQVMAWCRVDLSSVRLSIIHLRASSQEIPQPSVNEIIWKNRQLKCNSNFPGTNELICYWVLVSVVQFGCQVAVPLSGVFYMHSIHARKLSELTTKALLTLYVLNFSEGT